MNLPVKRVENHTAKQTTRTPLPLAVTFPLSGRFRDLHPLEHVRAGANTEKGLTPENGINPIQ